MSPTTHCDACGEFAAVLAIEGERSSQYICQTCGEIFERDIPAIEEPQPFKTAAQYQGRLFDMQEMPA